MYIITGGTAGIGFGITAHILQHDAAKIYLLSHKEEHAEEAIEALKKYGDTSRVEWVHCNLKSLKQTDEVAKKLAGLEKIDAVSLFCTFAWKAPANSYQLICNAGEGVGSYNETVDGLGNLAQNILWVGTDDNVDSHFQVNHLSQFHLAMMLLPILNKTPNSRLVFQSSDLHRVPLSKTHFTSVAEINTDIGPNSLYARTKLAQILIARAMVRRVVNNEPGFQSPKATGPWINAVHPGGVKTDQQDQAVNAYGTKAKVGVAMIRPFLKDPVDDGCRPALFAATSGDVVSESIQGQYVSPKVTLALISSPY